MAEPVISVRDLGASYGENVALERVTFDLRRGEMLGIVGPNGGGKSTLLKGLLGLISVGGEVSVCGGKLARKSRHLLGYVPQKEEVDLSFPVSVFDVAMMGRVPAMGLFGRIKKEDRRLVWEALETVGMADRARVRIGALSGGQQQRVFLARALAAQPEVLILDEPVSGVDAPSQQEIFELLEKLRGRGKSVIITSHDLSSTAERCDRVMLVNRRVVALGGPEEVFVPALLNEAYGGQIKVFNLNGRTMAVEEGHSGA